MPPTRRKLARGIYQDAYGISVIYRAEGKPVETRFPAGTSLARLERWRNRQRAQEQRTTTIRRNQLARDVVRYLKRLKGLAGYKSEKSHLRAWLQAFGPTTRRLITREACELVIADWRQAGYAPRTIRHRIRVLQSLYRVLDGAQAVTPLDEVKPPPRPRERPVAVSDTVIASVALQLRKQEIAGRLYDAKTRARFLVLATHNQRPCEVMRAQPGDVDLERKLWFTRTAKGGPHTIVPLNTEQLAAWQLFITADAWGAYDSRSFSKTLKRNGWPKDIRPYNLRHSTGIALSARGVDLGDIQALFGHASPETTRRFYVPGLIERLAAATQKLEGRFAGEGFHPASHVLPSHVSGKATRKGEKLRDKRRA